MTAGRKWVERNLGFDPISNPPPPETFTVKRVAVSAAKPKAKAAAPEDFQREIIDFDSESPAGLQFMAFSTATGLSRFTDIPWPKGLAPTTGPKPKGTPGKDSRNDYAPYRHNWATLSKKFRKGSPALQANRLGAYWTTKIGGKSVVVFKSDSHMSQDGPQLPNIDLWRQIIEEVKPKLVITTGTAGGIGKQFEVGDVVVSPVVRFDCTAKFKNQAFAQANFSTVAANSSKFTTAKALFKTNSAQLPKDNTRPPKIVKVTPKGLSSSVVTTDFFGFDTSDNHYKLQGLGDVSEMGDAILGLVASGMGPSAPRWLAIRNVSDPQIKAEGTLKEQAHIAAQIYKGFGRWSSVCSAITCWASIVAEP